MPRNRVQHQKGLSDEAFERLYPDEEACRKAWLAWRWPEGFKCPRCAGLKYCEIRGRQLLQCRQCRRQTSLIAGTVLQGTKLPMRVWFRAMHLLAQGKKGLSNIELGSIEGAAMNVRYRVDLSQAERDQLSTLLSGGTHASRKLKRAQILLAADAGVSDNDIAASIAVGGSTVYRTKRRFVEGNLEAALSEEQRRGAARKLTGKEEALLVATACSNPPEGRARWTLELLAGAMVRL